MWRRKAINNNLYNKLLSQVFHIISNRQTMLFGFLSLKTYACWKSYFAFLKKKKKKTFGRCRAVSTEGLRHHESRELKTGERKKERRKKQRRTKQKNKNCLKKDEIGEINEDKIVEGNK